jgi:hypothetical protein
VLPLSDVIAARHRSGSPAISRLLSVLNVQFGIQNSVSAGKCDASAHSNGVKKSGPFPATWIRSLDDFELNTFVVHHHAFLDSAQCEMPLFPAFRWSG